jgi:hypothetical protein
MCIILLYLKQKMFTQLFILLKHSVLIVSPIYHYCCHYKRFLLHIMYILRINYAMYHYIMYKITHTYTYTRCLYFERTTSFAIQLNQYRRIIHIFRPRYL